VLRPDFRRSARSRAGLGFSSTNSLDRGSRPMFWAPTQNGVGAQNMGRDPRSYIPSETWPFRVLIETVANCSTRLRTSGELVPSEKSSRVA